MGPRPLKSRKIYALAECKMIYNHPHVDRSRAGQAPRRPDASPTTRLASPSDRMSSHPPPPPPPPPPSPPRPPPRPPLAAPPPRLPPPAPRPLLGPRSPARPPRPRPRPRPRGGNELAASQRLPRPLLGGLPRPRAPRPRPAPLGFTSVDGLQSGNIQTASPATSRELSARTHRQRSSFGRKRRLLIRSVGGFGGMRGS